MPVFASQGFSEILATEIWMHWQSLNDNIQMLASTDLSPPTHPWSHWYLFHCLQCSYSPDLEQQHNWCAPWIHFYFQAQSPERWSNWSSQLLTLTCGRRSSVYLEISIKELHQEEKLLKWLHHACKMVQQVTKRVGSDFLTIVLLNSLTLEQWYSDSDDPLRVQWQNNMMHSLETMELDPFEARCVLEGIR